MPFSSATDNDSDNNFVKTSFTQDEETYLAEFIPAWRAKFYGDQMRARKGLKKSWVVQIPYAKFVEKFYPDGSLQPQAAMLQHKIYRWFLNRTNDGSNRSPRSRLQRVPRLKKPRATNGFNIFTEEKKEEIKQLKLKKINASSPTDNLSLYKESCKEIWAGLSAEYKEECSRKASQKNDLIKKGPTGEDIERNQSHIIQNTLSALSSLTGYHWTGHGDAAFFVMGAHRRMDGKLVTFYGSVLDGDDYASKGFHRTFSNFNGKIAEPFKAWAEKAIPGTVPRKTEMASPNNVINKALPLISHADGFPVLPDFDFNDTTPNDAKALLHQFVTAAWEHRRRGSECTQPIPWKDLSSMTKDTVLEEPRPFEDFHSLDPSIASIADTYSILETILVEQKNGARPLSFRPEGMDSRVNLDIDGERSISSPLSNGGTGELVGIVPTQRQGTDFSPLRPRGHRIHPDPALIAKFSLGDLPAIAPWNGDRGFTIDDENEHGNRRSSSATDKGSNQPGWDGIAEDRTIGKKRGSQTRMDAEEETEHPARQKQKALPAPKTRTKVEEDSSERKRTQLKVDANKHRSPQKNGRKRSDNIILPQRVQSARIRDKKYKNRRETTHRR
ncbi:hypothetical protein CVT26_001392 [Gymnopilus dilepis]|uniref:HMG box domain-containing protein n=1 Tax=Gymnopilus dilepis TaxID=231916 RepID=A0A409WK86_9AGAR|nr:hypothetical protein CVT26_001392 [Gymnopilus dilepis]